MGDSSDTDESFSEECVFTSPTKAAPPPSSHRGRTRKVTERSKHGRSAPLLQRTDRLMRNYDGDRRDSDRRQRHDEQGQRSNTRRADPSWQPARDSDRRLEYEDQVDGNGSAPRVNALSTRTPLAEMRRRKEQTAALLKLLPSGNGAYSSSSSSDHGARLNARSLGNEALPTARPAPRSQSERDAPPAQPNSQGRPPVERGRERDTAGNNRAVSGNAPNGDNRTHNPDARPTMRRSTSERRLNDSGGPQPVPNLRGSPNEDREGSTEQQQQQQQHAWPPPSFRHSDTKLRETVHRGSPDPGSPGDRSLLRVPSKTGGGRSSRDGSEQRESDRSSGRSSPVGGVVCVRATHARAPDANMRGSMEGKERGGFEAVLYSTPERVIPSKESTPADPPQKRSPSDSPGTNGTYAWYSPPPMPAQGGLASPRRRIASPRTLNSHPAPSADAGRSADSGRGAAAELTPHEVVSRETSVDREERFHDRQHTRQAPVPAGQEREGAGLGVSLTKPVTRTINAGNSRSVPDIDSRSARQPSAPRDDWDDGDGRVERNERATVPGGERGGDRGEGDYPQGRLGTTWAGARDARTSPKLSRVRDWADVDNVSPTRRTERSPHSGGGMGVTVGTLLGAIVGDGGAEDRAPWDPSRRLRLTGVGDWASSRRPKDREGGAPPRSANATREREKKVASDDESERVVPVKRTKKRSVSAKRPDRESEGDGSVWGQQRATDSAWRPRAASPTSSRPSIPLRGIIEADDDRIRQPLTTPRTLTVPRRDHRIDAAMTPTGNAYTPADAALMAAREAADQRNGINGRIMPAVPERPQRSPNSTPSTSHAELSATWTPGHSPSPRSSIDTRLRTPMSGSPAPPARGGSVSPRYGSPTRAGPRYDPSASPAGENRYAPLSPRKMSPDPLAGLLRATPPEDVERGTVNINANPRKPMLPEPHSGGPGRKPSPREPHERSLSPPRHISDDLRGLDMRGMDSKGPSLPPPASEQPRVRTKREPKRKGAQHAPSLENYFIERTLGKGNFASVLKGVSKHDQKPYAIKEIRDVRQKKGKTKACVVSEVKVTSAVSRHPNIVQYKEAMMSGENVYIVLEYVGGGTLKAKMEEEVSGGRPWPEDRILRHFVQICLAVKHLHDNDILHRDLKLENCFLTEDGRIKLGDFGLSRQLEGSAFTSTQTGTPTYMSPEISRGVAYDKKTDIWSMGIMLYEMAAGTCPFLGPSLGQLVQQIKYETQKPLLGYSAELRALCDSMLAKDPAGRPDIDAVLSTPVMRRAFALLSEREQSRFQKFDANHGVLRRSTASTPSEDSDDERVAGLHHVSEIEREIATPPGSTIYYTGPSSVGTTTTTTYASPATYGAYTPSTPTTTTTYSSPARTTGGGGAYGPSSTTYTTTGSPYKTATTQYTTSYSKAPSSYSSVPQRVYTQTQTSYGGSPTRIYR